MFLIYKYVEVPFNQITRMYSSRMRTARLLNISQHAQLGVVYLPGGGGVPGQGELYLPRGVVPAKGEL